MFYFYFLSMFIMKAMVLRLLKNNFQSDNRGYSHFIQQRLRERNAQKKYVTPPKISPFFCLFFSFSLASKSIHI